jgi:hypothetical protein
MHAPTPLLILCAFILTAEVQAPLPAFIDVPVSPT